MSFVDRPPAPTDVREDPVTGGQAIFVPRWTEAKEGLVLSEPLVLPPGSRPCPFCPNGAAATGPDVTARVVDETGEWSACAFPNRWPSSASPCDHEVVVLSRRHDVHFGSMSFAEAMLAFTLLLQRADAFAARGRYPLVHVGHGMAAGTTQPHPHGQLIGLDDVPPLVASELARSTHLCSLCRGGGDRTVARRGAASLVVPEAAKRDFTMLVVPDSHARALMPEDCAWGVGLAVRLLYAVWGPVSYNVVPCLAGHRHVHIVPRTGRESGWDLVELGTVFEEPASQATRLRAAAALVADWPTGDEETVAA